MTTEDEVTYAVKEFLSSKGWLILFYNPPGGQGGFFWGDPQFRGKGSQGTKIVDIICYDTGIILVIESKPHYSEKDKIKLDDLFSSQERIQYFKKKLAEHCKKLEITADIDKSVMIKALAFSGKVTKIPDDFILFVLNKMQVEFTLGNNVPQKIKKLLD